MSGQSYFYLFMNCFSKYFAYILLLGHGFSHSRKVKKYIRHFLFLSFFQPSINQLPG